MRIWAQEHVVHRLKVRKVLTVCEPYAYVRNRIYLANISLGLGAVVASKMLWMLPVTLLWYGIVYSLAIRHEEKRVTSQYGASYLAYEGAVRRWLPRVARDRGASCPHRAVGRALLAELHTPLIMAPATLKALGLVVPAVHLPRWRW